MFYFSYGFKTITGLMVAKYPERGDGVGVKVGVV